MGRLLLFQTILSDIFTDVQLQSSTDGRFIEAVEAACHAGNVQCTEYFMGKITQIYTLLQIRSGIMIIGEPFGGKTTICRMLAHALELMGHEEDVEDSASVRTAGNSFTSFIRITINQHNSV